MYLGGRLHLGDQTYPMAGVLPVDFVLGRKPRGHGYTILETTGPNPFFGPGKMIRGHEFHYSEPVVKYGEEVDFVFDVRRGHGVDGEKDGMRRGNVLGVYTHVHAAADPAWAAAILRAARSARFSGRKLLSAA